MEVDIADLRLGNDHKSIWIARDDSFPMFLGGNKARKMVHIIREIRNGKYGAVVTTGGIQSNHCRVVALACAVNNWKCKLVLHGTRDRFYSEKGNALIMRMTGAQVEFADPEDIGELMDRAMHELREDGFNPYYLQGGGHNRAGIEAYVGAVHDLKQSLPAYQEIDHIFLASGTGSTQAGIMAGCRQAGWNDTMVHGISIARNRHRGIEAIAEAFTFLHISPEEIKHDIHFYDDFLQGGYAQSSDYMKDFLARTARETGLILDLTYTGKAFYGMTEVIKKEHLTGEILFWHTGGLFNLMA